MKSIVLILIMLLATSCTTNCDFDCSQTGLELVYLRCDTQDQIFNTGSGWVHNGYWTGEDTEYIFHRESPVFHLESVHEIESITVDGLYYDYVVSYITTKQVDIYCEQWESYFDDFDTVKINLLIKKEMP